ncbi:MAG: DUF480 domain-containing protein, partial [Gemmatimonadota bacterium]|nr:DUF480 domain-containing protein [Gemmatimonadota bacterium]
GLVRSFQGIGSRVPKYQHLLDDASDLSRTEMAVLCVLALRGPQTIAELRTRATRLTGGDDANAVEAALEAMTVREPSVVSRLPRRPGQKELRYSQTLGGPVTFEPDDTPAHPPAQSAIERIAALEDTTTELGRQIADLRAQLEGFRKQFEQKYKPRS